MNRSPVLDNMKGIAILAVVTFHVLRGCQSAGLVAINPLTHFADSLAYGFHVQTFFIVAGFLTFPRAASLTFQKGRLISLYYSYLFWSVASWLIGYMLSSKVNSKVSFDELLYIPISPTEHFWFLLILMIGTALLAVLRSQYALLLAMLVFACMAFLGVIGWYGVCEFMIFICIGAWLRAGPGLPPTRAWAGWLGAALLVLSVWLSLSIEQPLSPIWFLWGSLGGCYACYMVSCWIIRFPAISNVVEYLGRNSMSIYLLHILGGSGVRIVLTMLAPDMPISLTLLLSLLGGIILPLVAHRIAQYMGISRWIGLDAILTPASSPAAARQNG